MDPLWSDTCWSNFKYFIIILIVSTNYIFVHLLDNKVFSHLLFKRISNHHSFLDGHTTPQLIISWRPLCHFCTAYWLFISSSTVILILFLLNKAYQGWSSNTLTLKCNSQDCVAVDDTILCLYKLWRPV